MLKIGDKKLINAWAFYDWANSVYSLVISTAVFPLFYSAITAGETVIFLGIEWEYADTLYSYALSFSFLVVKAEIFIPSCSLLEFHIIAFFVSKLNLIESGLTSLPACLK